MFGSIRSPTPAAFGAEAVLPSEDPPLSRREWGLIVAFWLGWGLLSVGNRVLDPIGAAEPRSGIGGALAVAAVEAICWIALTPAVFRLVARAGTERTPWPVRAGLFGGGALVVALALAVLGATVRHDWAGAPGEPIAWRQMPAPSPPDGGRFGEPPGPPLWFGFLNALVLYFGVLAAGAARAYALRYRTRDAQAARLRGALDSARLDALRRQLDPHFLFNTLNAVAALVDHDPAGVRRMIARLGELLRFSFSESDEPEIALRRELALLERYVDIMRVRFQGALTVETRVDDRALDVLVPAMILQPLMENAIKHGVERLDGAGTVTISAALDGDALVLAVHDDGPGPDAAGAVCGAGTGDAPAGDSPTGVGLRNTVARLAQLYGPLDASGDAPRQRFALRAAPDGGTVAELRLPVRPAAGAGSRTAGSSAARAA